MNFWNILFNLKTPAYSIKKKTRIKSSTVFKFRRLSSKKVIKKTKTNSLLRVIKLNLFFNIFSNMPPLSTLLNLIGLNVQKFCEELNKDILNLLVPNILIILKIFIKRDLNFEYNININNNFLIKNFNALDLIKSNLNLINLTKIKLFDQRNEQVIFNKRLYFNLDLFLLANFIFLNQFYFFNFNYFKNTLLLSFDLKRIILPYESVIHNIFSILKSFNLKLLKLKYINIK